MTLVRIQSSLQFGWSMKASARGSSDTKIVFLAQMKCCCGLKFDEVFVFLQIRAGDEKKHWLFAWLCFSIQGILFLGRNNDWHVIKFHFHYSRLDLALQDPFLDPLETEWCVLQPLQGAFPYFVLCTLEIDSSRPTWYRWIDGRS